MSCQESLLAEWIGNSKEITCNAHPRPEHWLRSQPSWGPRFPPRLTSLHKQHLAPRYLLRRVVPEVRALVQVYRQQLDRQDYMLTFNVTAANIWKGIDCQSDRIDSALIGWIGKTAWQLPLLAQNFTRTSSFTGTAVTRGCLPAEDFSLKICMCLMSHQYHRLASRCGVITGTAEQWLKPNCWQSHWNLEESQLKIVTTCVIQNLKNEKWKKKSWLGFGNRERTVMFVRTVMQAACREWLFLNTEHFGRFHSTFYAYIAPTEIEIKWVTTSTSDEEHYTATKEGSLTLS